MQCLDIKYLNYSFSYHCNYRSQEPDCPEEEAKFQEVADNVTENTWTLKKRFQAILMNGSMVSLVDC